MRYRPFLLAENILAKGKESFSENH